METLALVFNPLLIVLTAVGVVGGIFVGAMPGLSVTMATALLISFTYSWSTEAALAMMMGIYFGGVYGGSRSAILFNIPGTPSAIATGLDGYPMALQGKAGRAIGLATLQSVIGGVFGVIVMALMAPVVAEFALKFGPFEYFLLATLGILLVGSIGSSSLPRAVVSALLGITFSMVGMDPITGGARFTYGSSSMLGGIHFIVALIGLFGVTEILFQLRLGSAVPVAQMHDKVFPGWRTLAKHWWLTLRASAIGFIIGALPGLGGDIAALISYDHAKRTVRKPTAPFGQGAEEGVVAPETANNAAIGGALVPMLTLGIPGDAVTAVLIGALYVHGLKPGPMLMIDSPYVFKNILVASVWSNIFLVIFGLMAIPLFVRICQIRRGILLPFIYIISVVGAFSIQNRFSDVVWMTSFGFLGYAMRLGRFPVGPMVLGMILGPLMEASFRRAVLLAEGSLVKLLTSAITDPISAVLLAGVLFTLLSSMDSVRRLTNRIAGLFARSSQPQRIER